MTRSILAVEPMRTITLFLTALIFLVGVGCTSDAPVRASVPVVTPPPPPASPPAPPPVIADQTVVQLPAPQPIPPGSVPPRPPVEYHPPETALSSTVTAAPAKKVSRPPSTSPSAQKDASPKDSNPKDSNPKDASPKEPVPKDAAPKEGAPDQVPLPTEEPPTVAAPVTSAEDRTTSQGQITTILSEVRKLLSQAEAQPKTPTTTASITRINSLVRLSEQASSTNEPRQAESLAKRALALVRDLVHAH